MAIHTTEDWDRRFDVGIDIWLTDKAVRMVRYLKAPQRLNNMP